MRITEEQIQNYCVEQNLEIVNRFGASAEFKCLDCGNIVKRRIADGIRDKLKCRKCNFKKQHIEKFDTKKFNALLKKKNIKCVKFDINCSKLKCLNCDNKFTNPPRVMLRNNSGCKICALNETKIKRNQEKQYSKFIKKKNLKLLQPYIEAKIKVLHLCLNCSTEFKIRPNNVLNSKAKFNGCPTCKKDHIGNWISKPDQHHIDLVEQHNKVVVLELIKTLKQITGIKAQCIKCNYIFTSSPSDLKSGHGCPNCKNINYLKNATRRKYFVYKNKTYVLQGYEPQALTYLIKFKKLKSRDIKAGTESDIPLVVYYEGSKLRRHYPDIYIPKQNKLYEVKSTFTLGLEDRKKYYKNRLKCIAAKEQGYKYTLLLMNEKGERLKLPKKWYELTFSKFKKQFNEIHGTCY